MKDPKANPTVLGEAAPGTKVTLLDRGVRRPAVVTGRFEGLCWVRLLVNGRESDDPVPYLSATPLAAGGAT